MLLWFCQADGAGAHGAELLPLAQCSAALWWCTGSSEVLMQLTFVFKDMAGGVTSALQAGYKWACDRPVRAAKN